MGRAKKVVLAYSGGVDTSVCIPYLKQEWGVEDVITFAADLGQGDELEPIRQKALDAGASQSLVGDLIEPFIKDFAFPAIRANALYEGLYPLSTALARPLIAKRLVEVAPGRWVPMLSPMDAQARATTRCVLMWPSLHWHRISRCSLLPVSGA